jgi:hypothetical protein
VNTKRTINIDRYLALVTVTCCKVQHRIGVTTDGKLSFFDHGAVDALEERLREKGCMPPGSKCGEIQKHWGAGGDRYYLPEGLKIWHAYFRDKKHKPAIPKQPDDPLVKRTARERACLRIIEQATKTLALCTGYRRAEGRRNHSESVGVASRGLDPSIRCESTNERSDGCYTAKTEFRLLVELGWYSRVFRRELDIIDGCFVVDVISEHPMIVRAVKQSRGYNLIIAPASVTRGGKLKWI